jgi:hypothetical protein
MKRLAKPAYVAAAIIATIGLGVVLAIALLPKPKPRGKLPQVNIASLPPGGVLTHDTDSLRYFVLRPRQGDPYVLAAPLYEGAVPMPDVNWWKWVIACRDFGIDSVNGVVTNDALFRCRDTTQPEQWIGSWRWDNHGRNAPLPGSTAVANLYRVQFERDGDDLTFSALQPD